MTARFSKALCAATAALAVFAWAAPSLAGTTGGVHGRIVDAKTGTPIADAAVTASSPSQVARVTSNTSGFYSFISLAPDTYTVTVSKTGFETANVAGVTVISDQQRTVDVAMQASVRTLDRVLVRGTESLVRPGTTSDVYSINSAGQKAAAPLAGSGGLNQAYGAIASAPGVVYQQGQQGWYQSVYIRGGDIDQVAYEVDGVPVMRVSDSAPTATLSSLGNQEVQVYTGGTPASADATGIAGYVNQVMKTGTYPGFGNLDLGFGAPALYNKSTLEVGGATPTRNFSYYLGTSIVSQSFRYGDQFNGVSNPLFFFPMAIGTPQNGTVFDGNGGPFVAAPGASYSIATTGDRESVINLHFGLPHHFDTSKDDIQLLYLNSDILQRFYSSFIDLGFQNPDAVNAAFGGPIPFLDNVTYNGPLFSTPNPDLLAPALFPNSPQNRPPDAQIPITEREGSDNGVSLLKLQYQRNIDSRTYVRLFGYSDYATWFISGPVSAQLVYGAQLPDYEVIEHKYGANLTFSRQLTDKHLINLTASYMTSRLQTYSMGFFDGFFTNFIDGRGRCYDPMTGLRTSCFSQDPAVRGTADDLTPAISAPAGSPALVNNAQWIVTADGQNAQIDNVTPYFTAVSLSDQWRPTDRLTLNLGLRVENFKYRLQDLATGYPARQFWFDAFNRENCFATGTLNPVQPGFDDAGNPLPCPAGTTPTNVTNYRGGVQSETVPQPRLSFAYTLNPDTVIRGSYGRYARPAPTSYLEFNVVQQDLPSFLSQFVNLGYNSPFHDIHADTSNNYDFSLEQHIRGTDIAYKLTPFYRNTQGQLQYLALNAQGVLAGVNAGKQRSYGIEFAFNKGDFAKDGLALRAAVTLTRSRVKYGNFPNGVNIVDLLNTYVQTYNSYTAACASPSANAALCGDFAGANAQPSFTNNGVTTVNPYFNQPLQKPFDRNGEYTTYDLIPAPFNAALGFETPVSASLILNYKHQKLNFSPSFTYTTGSVYGSPLVWPGFDPASCGNVADNGATSGPQSCSNFIFIPDKYTGVFDNLGAFKEPSRLTASVSLGYEVSSRVKGTLSLTNLIDHCYQRGRPWDSPTTCVYGQLASNLLAPAGNFVSNPPVQLAYPYGSWYNDSEIGQIGQKSPPQAVLELEFKL
ncbi:MAG: TonB-dependent receptor domain-containing protein [Candidatus Eremiobacter antarcticus]|nr:TonB-dependent receptor [Candidatus Eremiobacteraeota bacterium]MBC5807092.1 TonB-dependent receptor [Candidatus Eremiobacteraeota bacterium]